MSSRNDGPQGLHSVDLDRLMNEHEAANFLGYTTRALQNWRLRGGGPLFVKVSDRSIRYRRRDLLAWTEQRLRSSTADPGPAATGAGARVPHQEAAAL